MTEHELEVVVELITHKIDSIYLREGCMMSRKEYESLNKKIDEWSKSVKISKPAW